MTASRRAAVGVIAALLTVGTVVSSRLHAAPAAQPSMPTMPTASASPLTAAWYCAGATGRPGGQADGSIVIANAGPTPATGTITVTPNDGHPASQAVTIGPRSRGVVHESDVAKGGFLGAVVVLHGGETAVEQEVAGPLGTSVAPCATRPSDRWYFAAGTTAPGASVVIALYNPFPQDALADLSFATDQGYSVPAPFQGMYVPAGTLLAVDLGQHVVERPQIASTVRVRVGRLVATKLQLDAKPGESGVSLVLGAPALAPSWTFPDGLVAAGVTESYHLYDPGDSPADVQLSLGLAQGGAEPIRVRLAPRSQAVVIANRQPRIPAGDPHTVVVTSSGAPVVAERTVVATSPSSRRGRGELLGATGPAATWLLASGAATGTADEWLIVYNPAGRPSEVSVSELDAGTLRPVDGLQGVVVPPRGRTALRLGDHLQGSGLSLVVSASVAMVLERDVYQVDGPGIALGIGIPVAAP